MDQLKQADDFLAAIQAGEATPPPPAKGKKGKAKAEDETAYSGVLGADELPPLLDEPPAEEEENEEANLSVSSLAAGNSVLELSGSRETFLSALQRVSHSVGQPTPGSVLENVVIHGLGEAVAIVGTSLEVSAITRASGVQVSQEGMAQIPFRKLFQAMSLAGHEFNLKVDGPRAVISTDGSVFELPTIDVDLFPTVPQATEDMLAFPTKSFRAAIEAVVPAASMDDSRPSINQVHFTDDGAYATDGTRVHYYGFNTGLVDLDIPMSAIRPLVQLLKVCPADVSYVQVTDGHIIFLIGSDEFSCRRLDAQFPDVRQVMIVPRISSHKTELTVPSARLTLAIKRATAMLTEDIPNATVVLKLTENMMNVFAVGSGHFSGRSEVPVAYSGKPRTLSFAAKAFVQAMDLAVEEMVTLKLNPNVSDSSILYAPAGFNSMAILLPRNTR